LAKFNLQGAAVRAASGAALRYWLAHMMRATHSTSDICSVRS
jgi:hypothetical protein